MPPEQGRPFAANLARECDCVVLRRIADPEFGAVLRQIWPSLARLWTDRGLIGDPEMIRTSDLQIRNLPLYPAELRGHSGALNQLSLVFSICITSHGLRALTS